jgi:hypothetical protein
MNERNSRESQYFLGPRSEVDASGDNHDLMPAVGEGSREVTADESRPSGDSDTHNSAPLN